MSSTLIDLLRHGEPVGGRKYRGRTDDPLSEKGWQQMRAAVGPNPPWQEIISSTLVRCSAFASELAGKLKVPLRTDPRLEELGFGEWEGHTADELNRLKPGQVDRFLDDPVGARPPGAEPLDQFRARVGSAWREISARGTGQHVLIVAHAGVIRMVLSQVLDIPPARMFRIVVPSAGLSRIEIVQRQGKPVPRLIFHHGNL
jgi:alpha-ribazole phosphatase/probable phosphoglycerate mutase